MYHPERASDRSPEDNKTLRFIANQIRTRREEKHLTLQDLSAKVNISVQQLRRIERAESASNIVTLLRLCRALGTEISSFAPSLKSEHEQVDELWERYELTTLFPGSADAPYLARKALLESGGRWVPPGDTPLAHPFARAGLVGELHNKGALNQVLADLPNATRMVRVLAISGIQSLEGPSAALDRLEALTRKQQTTIKFLLLSPTSRYFHELRAKEMTTLDAPGIRDRIKQSISRIEHQLMAADESNKRVQLFFYDRLPVWRLVFIDDKVYATFYPLEEGSKTPVLVYQADKEGRSFYWACHRVWHDHRQFATGIIPQRRSRNIPAAEMYELVASDAAAIKNVIT